MSSPNTCLSNRSSCRMPCNTVTRCCRPRTHRSATSAFGATRSRLCLLLPCTTEKQDASSIARFRPGDLFISFTARPILLNVSVFHPFLTSTMSSITTVKEGEEQESMNTTTTNVGSKKQRSCPWNPPQTFYLPTCHTTSETTDKKLI